MQGECRIDTNQAKPCAIQQLITIRVHSLESRQGNTQRVCAGLDARRAGVGRALPFQARAIPQTARHSPARRETRGGPPAVLRPLDVESLHWHQSALPTNRSGPLCVALLAIE